MKITRLLTALALLTSWFATGALAQESPGQATITAVTGAAQVSLNGSSLRATAGLKLPQGSIISTGKDGQVSIQVHEGIVAVAARNTKVEIERLSVSTNGTRNALMNLLTGNLSTSLDPARKSVTNYGVRTANGVALAKGTTLMVSVGDKTCTVSVLVGNVTVNWDGGISVSIAGNTPSDMTSSLGGQVRTESLAAALASNSTPGLADALAGAAAAVATVATNTAQVTAVIEAVAKVIGHGPAAAPTLANATALILTASFSAVANALPGTDGAALAQALILASNSVPGNSPMDASLLTPAVGGASNPVIQAKLHP